MRLFINWFLNKTILYKFGLKTLVKVLAIRPEILKSVG